MRFVADGIPHSPLLPRQCLAQSAASLDSPPHKKTPPHFVRPLVERALKRTAGDVNHIGRFASHNKPQLRVWGWSNCVTGWGKALQPPKCRVKSDGNVGPGLHNKGCRVSRQECQQKNATGWLTTDAGITSTSWDRMMRLLIWVLITWNGLPNSCKGMVRDPWVREEGGRGLVEYRARVCSVHGHWGDVDAGELPQRPARLLPPPTLLR